MDRTELAWAAGFWDGEGWANLVHFGRGEALRPMARINQSDSKDVPQVLKRFREVVGVGTISGPKLTEGREPMYCWVASSRAEVKQIAHLLGPWLGDVKRSQCEAILGRLPRIAWADIRLEERRAWAAGLWDGEGSVCLLKHRSHQGYFVPEASVTQSSANGRPEVLARIEALAAGGYWYGPFAQDRSPLPVYRWKLFRYDEIRAFFDQLWRWLGHVKRDQALAVFAVLDAQSKLPRGNPAWGSHKTHCVRGHEYVTARIRPFRGRGRNTEAPRASHQCLRCGREDARAKRIARRMTNGG